MIEGQENNMVEPNINKMDIPDDIDDKQIKQEHRVDVLPNQTLYINNLNEKIKLDELKQSLYHLFSQYGDILEIHARKSFKMKGQAFIVFREISAATAAKHALDNTIFFNKQMLVNYAKIPSDIILKQSGQYTHKDKIKKDQERRKRREQEYLEIKKKTAQGGQPKSKAEKVAKQNISTQETVLPNNVLFVENLPADISESILKAVFSKYNGLKEVRLFSGKGIAFVEYDNEVNAGGALLGLNGLNLTADCTLQISFAKK